MPSQECQIIERQLEELIREYRLSRGELGDDGFHKMDDINRRIAGDQMARVIWEALSKMPDEDNEALFLWCKLHCYLLPSLCFNRQQAINDFRALGLAEPFLAQRAKDIYRVIFAEFWVMKRPDGTWLVPKNTAAYLDEVWTK